ncbi:MAG: Cell surface glycan-binding lipoprotein, utilization system for glycans and polysaccharides (PUL), SusD family [uncultured Gemmatimonadetes bacterium]|uniref:Cell surface glycan-binding lipoprotein, utilization system for glycans and polysaccharides (PUL), SusD family n=1 Tax=uncultured Gemmatimonadota bacterium TaxID=203437 RepID=A0A6J4KNX1_9BACT|nr:MAG: Cell surface glycan-binding lipoprotein, utilization system for glycans and polysaccharides (PUL), SusD family [uncultured Gemmatimonadota bacterium]
MKIRAYRVLLLAAGLAAGAGACTDVTTEPVSTVTGSNVFDDPGSYRAFLAKLYGGLSVTGQQGPAGSGDVGGIDEGFSQYLRQLWQLQELPTDEAIIAWGDAGLPELNTQQWGASNQFISALYYRLYFQIALANEFMRETSDARLSQRNTGADLRGQIKQFRAEARFLRALSYFHGMDLYGNIPLVTEESRNGVAPPPQATRQQIYDYVVSELTAIRGDLPAIGEAEYGRADRGAVEMLLAKVYLNAQVYTGTARFAEARAAAEAVINSNAYQLDTNYLRIFSADNHTSPEMIFPVPFDGLNTRTYGGTTFLIHASVGGDLKAENYGIDGGWWGLRLRPEAFRFYASGDQRSSYFVMQETVENTSISDYKKGVAAPKYRNVTSTGRPGSNLTFPDTDFPLFRLADAHLMYAEAVLRGGGGSRAQALQYVNALRTRASAGNITDAQLTLDFILAERGRELLWEGHRRMDLIRFGRFTDQGVWSWKGGTLAGRTTAAHLNLYPIPASELAANPNLKQNPGY